MRSVNILRNTENTNIVFLSCKANRVLTYLNSASYWVNSRLYGLLRIYGYRNPS